MHRNLNLPMMFKITCTILLAGVLNCIQTPAPAREPKPEAKVMPTPVEPAGSLQSNLPPTQKLKPKARPADAQSSESPILPPVAVTVKEEPPGVVNDSLRAPAHDLLDSLLQKYVDDQGRVNYKGILADKARLYAYCKLLEAHPVEENWSREEQMAYWINAYNAFTIKLIVDNYPTKSILNFDGGKTWDVRRIKLGNNKYSLNQIENDILRPRFKDARIHFAINCAAKSCPPLLNRAYFPSNLDSLLEWRTRDFINDKKYNILNPQKAVVSKIFEWYGPDFGKLRDFLNRYAEIKLSEKATIQFQEYNWDLNE